MEEEGWVGWWGGRAGLDLEAAAEAAEDEDEQSDGGGGPAEDLVIDA